MRLSTIVPSALAAVLSSVLAVVPNSRVSAETIVEVAANTSDLSTFYSLLNSTNNAFVLLQNTDGPYTVFAPNNDAFVDLPRETLDFLTDPANKAELEAALYYHIIDTFLYSSTDLIALAPANISSLVGQDIEITTDDAGMMVMVNTATVVTADIAADNGIIHIIDQVLMVPQTTDDSLSSSSPEPAATDPPAPMTSEQPAVPSTGPPVTAPPSDSSTSNATRLYCSSVLAVVVSATIVVAGFLAA